MSVSLDAVIRPTRDIIQASKTLDANEVRFMVDAYYQMQEYRKASANQIRSLDQGADEGGTHQTLDWMLAQVETMENQIKRALDVFTDAHIIGAWTKGHVGIGPVIAAGLLAHIDITKAPTVGHIWRYAGLDPTQKWEKGQKRPWNAQLKTLCWKIGQSFMKFSGRDDCFYGQVYRQRKAYELERSESGAMAEYAATRVGTVGRTTEAHKHYSEGKLPPAQIDARARRYAVKLFLSHLHGEWHLRHFGVPAPLPYPIAHLGHAHVIAAPGTH